MASLTLVVVATGVPITLTGVGFGIDIGFVGEVSNVSTKEIKAAIRREVMPVISPIGAESDGTILNINADVAAASLAASLKASKLIYISDVPGIMRDHAAPDSLCRKNQNEQQETFRHD